ncbi:hypothetical protein [Microbacterium jejuense]|uniref:hypothetical protein n=1 Tax=Microbacterium jejuense TaxID=1263637 RepID=UPI0031E8ADA7
MSGHRGATVLFVIALLIDAFGFALVMPRRQGGGFVVDDLGTALPWAGALMLVGTLATLAVARRLPRSWAGVGVRVVLASMAAVALVVVLLRAPETSLELPQWLGLVGIVASGIVAAADAVHLRRARG